DPRLSGDERTGGLDRGRPSRGNRIYGKTLRRTHALQNQLRLRASHTQPKATVDDPKVARRAVGAQLLQGCLSASSIAPGRASSVNGFPKNAMAPRLNRRRSHFIVEISVVYDVLFQ